MDIVDYTNLWVSGDGVLPPPPPPAGSTAGKFWHTINPRVLPQVDRMLRREEEDELLEALFLDDNL